MHLIKFKIGPATYQALVQMATDERRSVPQQAATVLEEAVTRYLEAQLEGQKDDQ